MLTRKLQWKHTTSIINKAKLQQGHIQRERKLQQEICCISSINKTTLLAQNVLKSGEKKFNLNFTLIKKKKKKLQLRVISWNYSKQMISQITNARDRQFIMSKVKSNFSKIFPLYAI